MRKGGRVRVRDGGAGRGGYALGMTMTKWLVMLAFAAVLGVPFIFALTREGTVTPDNAERLVVITPHNEQIRDEFERAFSGWHEREHGVAVDIDWRTPGGTSEIRKQLQSIYTSAIRNGQFTLEGELVQNNSGRPISGPMPNDVLFGGGSYEHGQIKRGVSASVEIGGEDVTIDLPMSVPVGFTDAELRETFGPNEIGSDRLYDEDVYWVGTALSGFGIVYNRDVLRDLGLDEPVSWRDMTDPGYVGWIALADPRMSGSVTTTYDSILNIYGWEEGWKILRDMSANARYFAHVSTMIPIDVSRGESATGVAIDFYGRYQSQAFMGEGETVDEARVGYAYPVEVLEDGSTVGAVLIDADPVSKLRGGPNPVVADRFVRWLVSREAQAIWQYRAGEDERSVTGGEIDLGPARFELRRLPVRRDMYTPEEMSLFVDGDVDPFRLARPISSRGWRSAIAPMMAAFAIENQRPLRLAWLELNRVRDLAAERPGDTALAETLAEMERTFYAMPVHRFPDDLKARDDAGRETDEIHELAGTEMRFTAETYRTIRAADWVNRQPTARGRIMYLGFFRDQYERVLELGASIP